MHATMCIPCFLKKCINCTIFTATLASHELDQTPGSTPGAHQ